MDLWLLERLSACFLTFKTLVPLNLRCHSRLITDLVNVRYSNNIAKGVTLVTIHVCSSSGASPSALYYSIYLIQVTMQVGCASW